MLSQLFSSLYQCLGARECLEAAALAAAAKSNVFLHHHMPNLTCPAAITLEKSTVDQDARTDTMAYFQDNKAAVKRMCTAIKEFAQGIRLAII